MKIALTGATGFIGHYLVAHLASGGHQLRCWHREGSNLSGLAPYNDAVQWLPGDLADLASAERLIDGCDAVVHNAFWRPGTGFRGAEGDVVEFARVNVLGSLNLIETSISKGIGKFVFVSSGAVHEKILSNHPLDETHPLWPLSHYGAHKAAIEKFVHSYGLGSGFPICAVRPTGVYGLRRPAQTSKWFGLIEKIVRGEPVDVNGGGKEVHASDVAKAIGILLQTNAIAGESFACYDQYVSHFEVAMLAKEIVGGSSEITGVARKPKHQIVTQKIQDLGMSFGGTPLLRQTIAEIIGAIQAQKKGD